jgi:hypothetical protein
MQRLEGAAVDQPVACWVHQQAIVTQKIHTNNGELNSGQQKRPAEILPVEGQLELPFSLAWDGLTSCT